MQAAADLAHLADRALHLVARAHDQLAGTIGVGVEVMLGHAEVEPDRDQLLLHAVVQVAFDPAPFAGDGVEDVLALRGERRDAALGGGQAGRGRGTSS